MFEKARLKLTAWYLAIIMAISVLFSFVIYSNINIEFRRFEKVSEAMQVGEGKRFLISLNHMRVPPPRFDPEAIQQARVRLVTTLGFINLIILGVAGAAGYFLAGRTLRPIQKMVLEQNRFITDASHELRTPLTSLRSEIEVGLRSKQLTLTKAKSILKSNLEEAISLQTLSDNLLELAQIGKPSAKALTTISLNKVLDQAIKKLNGTIKKKEITIQRSIGEVTIYGVFERITELFVILLDNAVKYSPVKSSVIIAAKVQNDIVDISVSDQGIGIADEDLPHIFERFFRASKSRSKEKVAGYGLGLAIAKEIVTSHNGAISVKSIEKGGTTVTVSLLTK